MVIYKCSKGTAIKPNIKKLQNKNSKGRGNNDKKKNYET